MKKKLLQHLVMVSKYALVGVFMQTLLTGMLLASELSAQEVKSVREVYVTLKTNNHTVQEILEHIESETDYSFSYYKNEIDLSKRIRINNLQQSVYDLLIDVSAKTALSFRQINNVINVKNKEKGDEKEGVEIVKLALVVTGKVTSISDDNPLPGVNILIKGSNIGTVTDVDGNYSINVPNEDDVLVFSSIGYLNEEVPVNSRQTIDVVLSEDIQSLSEVVVVGYGTVKKSDLTGSISQVKAEELQNVTISSVQQGLQGRAAGVQVNQGSSMPGGGISIRIRGTNSINSNNEPLYVIDGFPLMTNSSAIPSGGESNTVSENPLANLNPSDIESMEILKDASATAIYGSRGANGVILITTKRAKEGTSLVNFEASYGVQKVARLYDVLNTAQFITMANETALAQGTNLPFPDNKPVTPYSPDTDTDWQKEIYQIAPIQQYNLTAQGGNENTKYSLTAGYFNQEGVVKESGFERFSLRMNADKKIGKKLQVSNSLLVSRILNDRVATEGTNNQNAGPTNAAVLYRPTLPVYNLDGSYTQNTQDGSLELLDGGQENPLASILEQDNLLTKDDILGNISVQYEPIPNLIFKSSLGANINHSRRDLYSSRLTNEGGRGTNGLAIIARADIQSFLNENTISYNKDFGKHRINLLGGYTIQKEIGTRDQMRNTQFPNDITKQYDIGAGTQAGGPNVSSSKWDWSIASYLTRLNYVFNNKYLATFTYRVDGSSKFGKDNKWASFPSAALAWRASEEDFIKQLNLFSNLKVRTSWGVTGNSEIGSYQSLARYGLLNYSFNENEVSAFYPSSLSNPDLKWETTSQYDVGIDFGFLNNKLTVEFDYYQKFTKNGLLSVNLPSNSGFSAAIMNLAKIENKGFEMTLNAVPMEGEFNWDVSANYSMNRNKVTDLGGLGKVYGASVSGDFRWGNATFVEEGQPIGMFFGYRNGGVFENEAEIESWQNGFQVGTAEPGDRKYFDVNEDGKLDANDREIIGNPHPDFTIGFSNNFSYKNFSLSIFMQGVSGNDVLNVNRYQLYQGNSPALNKAVERYEKRWTAENPKAEWPRFGDSDQISDNVESWIIEDGSFIRIRSIVLGYNIPVNRLDWIQKAQVRLSGDNLFLFTKYTGYDPDVNTMMGAGNSSLGIDNGSYPNAKVYKLSLSVTF